MTLQTSIGNCYTKKMYLFLKHSEAVCVCAVLCCAALQCRFSEENQRMEEKKEAEETEKRYTNGVGEENGGDFSVPLFSASHSDNNNHTWSEIKRTLQKT